MRSRFAGWRAVAGPSSVATTSPHDPGTRKSFPARRLGTRLLTLLLLSGTALIAPWSDNDAHASSAQYVLRSYRGSCIGPVGNWDGARVTEYGCGPIWTRWYLGWAGYHAGRDYYYFVNAETGKCLDVRGISGWDGAEVFTWSCWNGPNQAWNRRSRSGFNQFELVALHSGKCLELHGPIGIYQYQPQQWPCRPDIRAQSWYVSSV
ncbi:MAG TPA: RICIN domain-containing protein [Pilimelia sp.]|nr:RICIN domain-containing protein [Pilimelia sp.]